MASGYLDVELAVAAAAMGSQPSSSTETSPVSPDFSHEKEKPVTMARAVSDGADSVQVGEGEKVELRTMRWW